MIEFGLGVITASVFWVYWFYYHKMVVAKIKNRGKIIISNEKRN
tara:strand:+ start:3897 stop:4028 length:132 start_codon:yes stop_codon:yes gene_type:complete